MRSVPRYALPALLALAACRAPDDRPVTLGAAGPWELPVGIMARRGIELALADLNADGGPGGRRVVVKFRDDTNDGAVAARVARDFVEDETVLGVVGHLASTPMLAAARVYHESVTALTPTATSPELDGMSPWVVRLLPSDSVTGEKLGAIVRAQPSARVAVLYENTAYGRGLAESFVRGLGRDPVSIDPIAVDANGLDPVIRRLAAERPTLLFIAGNASRVPVYRAVRAALPTVPILAGDGWAGLDDHLAPTATTVAVGFSPVDPRPEVQRFVAAFTRTYGVRPDAFAALAYDATLALGRAAAVGGDREGTRRALLALGDEAGYVTGPMRFAASGEPTGRDARLLAVEGRTLRAVRAP
jgi:branched-chain amino acid transport system substrate-binding protein